MSNRKPQRWRRTLVAPFRLNNFTSNDKWNPIFFDLSCVEEVTMPKVEVTIFYSVRTKSKGTCISVSPTNCSRQSWQRILCSYVIDYATRGKASQMVPREIVVNNCTT